MVARRRSVCSSHSTKGHIFSWKALATGNVRSRALIRSWAPRLRRSKRCEEMGRCPLTWLRSCSCDWMCAFSEGARLRITSLPMVIREVMLLCRSSSSLFRNCRAC
ncbi:unnamed protein product, partial [Ixodes persulcatus]